MISPPHTHFYPQAGSGTTRICNSLCVGVCCCCFVLDFPLLLCYEYQSELQMAGTNQYRCAIRKLCEKSLNFLLPDPTSISRNHMVSNAAMFCSWGASGRRGCWGIFQVDKRYRPGCTYDNMPLPTQPLFLPLHHRLCLFPPTTCIPPSLTSHRHHRHY